MKIAVIVLNYNSSSDCRKCIGYLKQQEGVEIEIVVVDNCSPCEGEQDAVQQLCQEQDCTFIPADRNRGYNAGNNIGLRYAAQKGYEYALIANPDMEFPDKGYISCLSAKMESDKHIAVCGSDIVSLEGRHENPMKRDGGWIESWSWLVSLLYNRNKQMINYKTSDYCNKVSGCCLMLRIHFIESIGYLDENVFLFCEEAILARQVEMAGMRTFYMADIQAIHAHIKGCKGDPIKRYDAWKKSRRYFVKRYSKNSSIGKLMEYLSIHSYVFAYKLSRFIKH